jgi:hypothetical protein
MRFGAMLSLFVVLMSGCAPSNHQDVAKPERSDIHGEEVGVNLPGRQHEMIRYGWEAAAAKYPDMGSISEYTISANGTVEFMSVYFTRDTEALPLPPTTIVNIRNGRVTDVFRSDLAPEFPQGPVHGACPQPPCKS